MDFRGGGLGIHPSVRRGRCLRLPRAHHGGALRAANTLSLGRLAPPSVGRQPRDDTGTRRMNVGHDLRYVLSQR